MSQEMTHKEALTHLAHTAVMVVIVFAVIALTSWLMTGSVAEKCRDFGRFTFMEVEYRCEPMPVSSDNE